MGANKKNKIKERQIFVTLLCFKQRPNTANKGTIIPSQKYCEAAINNYFIIHRLHMTIIFFNNQLIAQCVKFQKIMCGKKPIIMPWSPSK